MKPLLSKHPFLPHSVFCCFLSILLAPVDIHDKLFLHRLSHIRPLDRLQDHIKQSICVLHCPRDLHACAAVFAATSITPRRVNPVRFIYRDGTAVRLNEGAVVMRAHVSTHCAKGRLYGGPVDVLRPKGKRCVGWLRDIFEGQRRGLRHLVERLAEHH
jgi:hypothetical protein